jgi:hypothetical protein
VLARFLLAVVVAADAALAVVLAELNWINEQNSFSFCI